MNRQKKHDAGKPELGVGGREIGAIRKELLFVVVLVILCAVIVLYALLSGRIPKTRIIKEGDAAPAFTLRTTKQASLALSDYRGKVVLVHFWATWCPPCVEELPQLEKLYRTLRGKDFEILAVSVDDDEAKSVGPFLAKNVVSFPVLFDPGGPVARRYGTIKFPETYVLDRGGTVRFKVIGPLEWTSQDTITAIQRLISE
ncbi:MAG TPA: TlpA disulfide reductase family protein [Nitrospirota bacterium]|nr:TlpA disulfide reductase family protein [Nitrospirota bacterium]